MLSSSSFLNHVLPSGPKANLAILAALVLLLAAAAGKLLLLSARLWKRVPRRRASISPSPPPTPVRDSKTRAPGEWIPSDFEFPKPPPYPDWDLETTKPLPYRAFRYGPKYNVTMGLRSIHHHDWIQLDNHYPRYHAEKARRIAERGRKCCHTAPEAYPAAVELLQELVEYLPRRYPSLYRRTATGIDNLWSGESLNVAERPLREDPMALCGRLVQDDLALMVERADGQYYLLAGAVLLAGFWRLEDKFGLPLSAIHTSGEVPQFRERLESGMVKFFRRLGCADLYARNNYFVQVDDALAWSWSIGDEDGTPVGWAGAARDRAVAHHHFRAERQTLRRLPRSGAVVFTIRTYFHPVADLAREDYVPGRLASAIRSWGPDVGRYKGRDRYGDVLLAYLDREHQKQLDRGLDPDKEDDVRQYPW